MPDESDYMLAASPQARVVSVGAVVDYTLTRINPKAKPPKDLGIQWFAINDPATVSWRRPKQFKGPLGYTTWNDAKWDVAGRHKILCIVRNDGKQTTFEYEQHVAPLMDVVAAGPALMFTTDDANGVLDSVSRLIAVIEEVAKKHPPTAGKVSERHKDQVAKLIDYRDKLKERLASTEGKPRHALSVEHFDQESQRRTKLCVFAARMGPNQWKIVDWTNPTVQALTGEYDGMGSSPLGALEAAIKDWDEDNRYPNGAIRVRIPDLPDVGTNIARQFVTDGGSFWDSVSTFFTYVGFGAAIVAGVVTLVAPVPGSQVASAAIWVSIFSSSAAATINIGQRYQEGFNSWRADAFDVLSIAGNLFGAAGIVWARGATVTLQVSGKVVTRVLVAQIATDGLQGILLTVEGYEEIERIKANPDLTPNEKVDKILEVLRAWVLAATLTTINIKATKADVDNLKKAPLHIPGKTPEENLKLLADPKAKVDLTPPPKVEGHTDKGQHKTKVQVDQEEKPPHAGGRPKVVPPPRSKTQRFKDAMGNSHYEKHLKDVPALRAKHSFLASLSDDEIIAIRGYVTNDEKPEFGNKRDYERLNQALRTKDAAQLSILDEYIDFLKSGLAKMPPFEGTVHRVMNGVYPHEVKAMFKVGDTWSDRGFLSTSHGKSLDHAQVTISIEKTRSGKMVESVNPYPEREVLFPPEIKFKVITCHEYIPGRFLIMLREI